MVRGDGRLQRGENVNLARLADFEHRAAAIADVQVLFRIKGDAGGHAHPFHVDRHIAGGSGLINDAVVAAGYVECAGLVERQASSVHDFAGEGFRVVVQIDLVDRHGRLLAAGSAEGDVDVAERVHSRVADRIEIFGNLDSDVAGPGLAA